MTGGQISERTSLFFGKFSPLFQVRQPKQLTKSKQVLHLKAGGDWTNSRFSSELFTRATKRNTDLRPKPVAIMQENVLNEVLHSYQITHLLHSFVCADSASHGLQKGHVFVGHLCSWHGFSCVIFIGLEGKAEREQASSGSANLYWKSR